MSALSVGEDCRGSHAFAANLLKLLPLLAEHLEGCQVSRQNPSQYSNQLISMWGSQESPDQG